MQAVNQPHIPGNSTANFLKKLQARCHDARNANPSAVRSREFVFGTAEAAPTASSVTPLALETQPMETEALPPSAKSTASLTSETLPAAEAALPSPIPPIPEAPVPEPIPFQSKESSLTHRLQAPDKEATVRFTVDMSVGRTPQAVAAGSKDGRKKVDSWCGCCWRMG